MTRCGALAVFAVLPIVGACKGSVSAEAKAEAELPEYDQPLEPVPSSDEGFGAGSDDSYGTEALVGARHDLQLALKNPTATCRCVAVAVGQPDDATFFWQAGAPRTAAGVQLVIALTSEGVPCSEASGESLGASYWGYRQDGENIVVVVEEAHFGRPITSGAIIPRPGPNGAVYVEPLNARIPYGKPLSEGDRYCRVQVTDKTAPSSSP